MARLKIDYGIDLGTTNSAICRMEKGVPTIQKIEVTDDIMPSCVFVNRRRSLIVGASAYKSMKDEKCRATKTLKGETSNAYLEFKRTMGTDTKYHSTNLDKDFTSEELSAEVLKSLKSYVDEVFRSVVITVPAKFTVGQKTATIEAAKLAGFDYCELLQEPLAACYAYGLTSEQKYGIWMVFDFGGGTFDAALVKVEDGIISVLDTAGDNYLGGKDLDAAIVESILVPYLRNNYSMDNIFADSNKNIIWREALKTKAEEVKNKLSFKESEDLLTDLGEFGEDEDGEEVEIDMTISQQEVFDAMRPLFQKAVDICKSLLQKNNLKGSDLNKLILVGGPTHSPLIRQMLREQITPNVDTSIDPMTAVATGAALYASTKDAYVKESDIEVGTIKLDIGYEATSVEQTEWVSVKLDKIGSGSSCPAKVLVELVRGDNAWSSGKTEIDEMGNVIEANLIEGKSNAFSIVCYNEIGDQLPCFPSEITIIQGSKVGSAPLPYNIGIAIWDEYKNKAVFKAATGLEKNKPVPAIGVVNGLSTSKQLRPGLESDLLTIPIYQCEDDPEAGRTAALYEYVADVIVTGEEVESLIPENSPVDITLKVDSSEQMTIDLYFPSADFTISKSLDTSKKQSVGEAEKLIPQMIRDAQKDINRLAESGVNMEALQNELNSVMDEDKNSHEKKAVLQHLKEVLRKIEDEDAGSEWDRLERDIREEFERMERADRELGNDKSHQLTSQLRSHTDQVIRSKNVLMGREVLEQISNLYFQLTMVYQCMGLIRDCNSNFGYYRWKDTNRARQLINQGMSLMVNQPTVEQLQPIAVQLIGLMPDDDAGNKGGFLH